MIAHKLTPLTAVGITSSVMVNQAGLHPSKLSVQVNLTGDPTAATVIMEGSLDGKSWMALDTHVIDAGELTAFGALYFVADKPVKYIRANVSVLTFTTAGTVAVVTSASL